MDNRLCNAELVNNMYFTVTKMLGIVYLAHNA